MKTPTFTAEQHQESAEKYGIPRGPYQALGVYGSRETEMIAPVQHQSGEIVAVRVGPDIKQAERLRDLVADLPTTLLHRDALLAENERLREALASLVGTTKNEMTLRGLPLEWTPDSAMGKATAALTCTSPSRVGELEKVCNKFVALMQRDENPDLLSLVNLLHETTAALAGGGK